MRDLKQAEFQSLFFCKMFKFLKKKQLINLGASLIVLTFLTGCPGIELDCTTKKTTKPRHLKRLAKTNNCRGCNLGDADLSGANLKGADLKKAKLVNANLDGADLQKADLSQAQLSWYDIDGGNGFGFYRTSCDVDLAASLKKANLGSANLEGANLGRANLGSSNLEGANLGRANLGSSNLKGANLKGANLEGANLEGAYLAVANLEGANLKGANLEGADSGGANLERVIMPDGTVYQGDSQK